MLLGFNCDTYSLSSEIQVLEDDVIGACIFDQVPHSMELPLVAESAMDGYSMLYLDERTAGCETNVLPDVVNNLRVDPLLKVLHVSARIHVGEHNKSSSPQ